ncbi:unnamed protein product [Caenorhabditis brenneri]
MSVNYMPSQPTSYLVLSYRHDNSSGYFRTENGDVCQFQNSEGLDIETGDWIQCEISEQMHVGNVRRVRKPYWVASAEIGVNGVYEIKGFLHKGWSFIEKDTVVYVFNEDIGWLSIILKCLNEPEKMTDMNATCGWEVVYCMGVAEETIQSPPPNNHSETETAMVVKIMNNLILVLVFSTNKLAEITWSTNYNPTELKYRMVFECEVHNIPGRYSRFRVININSKSQYGPMLIEGTENVSHRDDMDLEIKLLDMRSVHEHYVTFDCDCGLVRIPNEIGTPSKCIGLHAYCSLLVGGHDCSEDIWVVKKVISYLIKNNETLYVIEEYPETMVYTSLLGRCSMRMLSGMGIFFTCEIRQRVNGELYIGSNFKCTDDSPPPLSTDVVLHAPTKYLVVKSSVNQDGSTSGEILTAENQLLKFHNPNDVVIKVNDWISCKISDQNEITAIELVLISEWIAHGKLDDDDEIQITLTGNLEKSKENDEIVDRFYHVYHKNVGFIQVDQSHYMKGSKTDQNGSKFIRDCGTVVAHSNGCYEVWLKNLKEVAYFEGKEMCDFTNLGHQFDCEIQKSEGFRDYRYKVLKIGSRLLEHNFPKFATRENYRMSINIQFKEQKEAINSSGCPTFESDYGDVLVPPKFLARVAPHHKSMECVCYLKLWETTHGWKRFWTVKEIDYFQYKTAPIIREDEFAVVLEDEDEVSGCYKVFTPLLGECKVHKELMYERPKIGDFIVCKISQLPNDEGYISDGAPMNIFDKFNETSNTSIFRPNLVPRWKIGKLVLQADEYRIHEHNFFGLIKVHRQDMETFDTQNLPDEVIQIRNSMTPISVQGKENDWRTFLQKLQIKYRLYCIWWRELEKIEQSWD